MTHFQGWMLESAHNYLKAAELLDAQNLPHVALGNGAIGMEILLKSFIFVPDQHGGASGETYSLTSKHSKWLTITCSRSARSHPNKSVTLTIC
ncbi:hypothetical protein [Pseudomonas sp. LB-090624]|uniref:hypothetical protein n=1 Tax=Pseudomonas sp. LB-090624 TaxID=2213079 RepID=UPI00211526DB|nr:hypothetical protein [Pseudomonas sp. LB-090624]